MSSFEDFFLGGGGEILTFMNFVMWTCLVLCGLFVDHDVDVFFFFFIVWIFGNFL